MSRLKVVSIDSYNDAQETIRQLRFKLKAFGVLIGYAQQHLPKEANAEINVALFDLTRHLRGEKPLCFPFLGEKVEEP